MSLLELPSERNNDKINNSNNFNFGETAIDERTYNNDEANINKGTNEILPSIYAPSNTINTKIKSDSEKNGTSIVPEIDISGAATVFVADEVGELRTR
jgi:hypothetical protein